MGNYFSTKNNNEKEKIQLVETSNNTELETNNLLSNDTEEINEHIKDASNNSIIISEETNVNKIIENAKVEIEYIINESMQNVKEIKEIKDIEEIKEIKDIEEIKEIKDIEEIKEINSNLEKAIIFEKSENVTKVNSLTEELTNSTQLTQHVPLKIASKNKKRNKKSLIK
jgi:hypothetical protein